MNTQFDHETNGKRVERTDGPVRRFSRFLIQLGLGETLLKLMTSALSAIAIISVVLLMQMFTQKVSGTRLGASQTTGPTQSVEVDVNSIREAEASISGVGRAAQLHTIIPSRPRKEIVKYTVQDGDTIFGISQKYGLEPETVLWANYYTLLDDPHSLKPGQELNILPVNGTYHEWHKGEGLNGVAKYYGVKPEDIVNFAANNLDPTTIGDYSNPNIKPGTFLIVPGGRREFVSWSAPLGITRNDTASARVLGQGWFDPISGGAVGFGTFVWPSNKHYLSGFDYSPKTNHWGIDIAGSEGEGVYATDAGVVVYSGWNEFGYGNMVMIDHGNGFQSLYAHLSQIYRFCGQSVGQGEGIGAIGTTGRSSGPHLHFEIMTATYKTNPWDLLPPP